MKLEQQSIGTLCQLIQDGDLTALELCQFYLERIENYDFHGPQLNSVIELNPDVLNLAEILDIERSKKFQEVLFMEFLSCSRTTLTLVTEW